MAQKQPRIIGILAIVLLAGAGSAGVISLNKRAESTTTASSTPAMTAMSSPASSASSTGTNAYKDGTYTASGGYNSPGGAEAIGVTLTVKNDIVTASSLDTSQTTGVATQYQSQFASGYKPSVIGKKLASISLSRVSGSSLTSNGFNNAVKAIESKAKA